MEAYFLSSFTEKTSGGNKAAVALDDNSLSDYQRINIAKHIGFSETAFIKVEDKHTLNIRFFTPLQEVGLCGHAALAAVELALKEKLVFHNNNFIYLRTQEGLLRASIDKSESNSNIISIEQPSARFRSQLTGEELGDLALSLGIEKKNIGITGETIFPQPVYTGLWDIICPIEDIITLQYINPDYGKIKELSIEHGVTGIHCIYYDRIENLIYARNFAPLVGIDEEAATGTSSGAASAYIVKKLNLETPAKFIFHQGMWMNSPSQIYTVVEEGLTPWVGGNAVIVSRETIDENFI